MHELTVVIVNYNSADLTYDCIESIIRDPSIPATTQIVVADNASPAGDAGRLTRTVVERDWSDRVTLLALPANGGFAAGNNAAIAAADMKFGLAEFYVLLNPDTVCRPEALATLVRFMRDNPRVGIGGSRLEDADGTRQACAFRFPGFFGELEATFRLGPVSRLLRRWQIAPEPPPSACQVDWVSGACMIIGRDVLQDIGVLDDGYFLYYEELDFCLRAARGGWPSWHVPASRVIHLVGQSTGVTRRDGPLPRRPAYWFRSRRRYFVKNYGQVYAFLTDLAWLAGQLGFRVRQVVKPMINREPPGLLTDFIRYSWLGR